MKYQLPICTALLTISFQGSILANNLSESKPHSQTKPISTLVNKIQSNTVEIGYQIGDIAHQTVTIQTPKGYIFDTSSLPVQGKGASFIELRNVRWHTNEEGDISLHKIELDWQIFRVMQETRTYSLKPLDLMFHTKLANDATLNVHVDAARVIVASLLPTSMDATHTKPLEDVAPLLRNTKPIIITLWLSLTSLILSFLYLAYLFDWLPAKLTSYFAAPKPFRHAYREMSALQRSGDSFTQLSTAICSLRRAFDMTAGATLSAERVSLVFEHNVKLTSKRTEIEHFYAESDRVFFAGSSPTYSLKQIMKLCHQLMMIESS